MPWLKRLTSALSPDGRCILLRSNTGFIKQFKNEGAWAGGRGAGGGGIEGRVEGRDLCVQLEKGRGVRIALHVADVPTSSACLALKGIA